MREVRRTAIVPYTPAQMYVLVNDVRRYPEFVPWCPATRVHDETETTIDATVDVARSGLTISMRTRNTMIPGERIDLHLADGPLRTLEGSWLFRPILGPLPESAPEVPAPPPAVRGCRVELAVRFEFGNAALTMMLAPVFEASWDSLVDAFVVRAREVYGAATAASPAADLTLAPPTVGTP